MKGIFIISCLILGLSGLSQLTIKVFAEGGTPPVPDSGATSRIKTLDDALTILGVGSTASGGWGDWGAMWNRIYSAGIWDAVLGDATTGEVFLGKKFYAGANRTLLTGTFSFTGDAAVGDVVTGKTFYAGNSTKQTGTGPVLIDFSLQQYSAIDDHGGPNGSGAEDYQGEESIWTSDVTNVWKDTRTGLYWSDNKGSKPNNFTLASCPFFTTEPRSNYNGTDTTNCGAANNAINYCATLNFGGKTDWYLPSQKELMQAYIDGMNNKAGTTLANAASFTTTNYFWSSSELSAGATYGWRVNLDYSYTDNAAKGNSNPVRCVRRD